MTECVFCKMVAGEIPVTAVYEDDAVLAFDDIAPQAPVHVLVIPKTHHAHLGDSVPAETAAALMRAVPLVAALKGVESTGYRVIVNNGPDANQTVGHLHVHIMGGKAMAHGMVEFE